MRRRRHRNDQPNETAVNEPIPVFASASEEKSVEGSFAKDSRRIQAEGDGRAVGVHWPKRSDFPDPCFRKRQRRKISGRFVRQRLPANPSRRRRTSRWSPLAQAERLSRSPFSQAPAQKNQRKVRSPKISCLFPSFTCDTRTHVYTAYYNIHLFIDRGPLPKEFQFFCLHFPRKPDKCNELHQPGSLFPSILHKYNIQRMNTQ